MMLDFLKSSRGHSATNRMTTVADQKSQKPQFTSLKVTDVRRETADCVSVALDAPDSFRYLPGQYITFKQEVNGEELRRSYSLCSSPLESELRVAIKQIEGGRFSTWANNELSAGMSLDTMPPMGNFVAETEPSQAKHYVCFAAGSGITPMMSILKTVLGREPESRVTLFYGNRSAGTIIFKAELEDLKDAHIGRLEVHHVLSREDQGSDLLYGRMDRERLDAMLNHFEDVASADDFYLCGPESMINDAREALQAQGVAESAIHFELFTASTAAGDAGAAASSATSTGQHQITVILDDEETHFTQDGGTSILDAAIKAGADVPYACKGAVCCTCRAKVMEGDAELKMNYSLTDGEVEDGFILTCQAYPTSEKVVVSFDE